MKTKLAQIDQLLAGMTVKGDDVFLMVNIRKLLKEVYDELEERSKNDGE